MDYANFLNQVFMEVQNQTATTDEQIDRLQRAKYDLLDEQATCMNEVKQIKDPCLKSLWEGKRAHQCDEAREEAFHTMRATIQNYECYINQVESKITALHAQMDYINTTGSMAHTADQLLERKEETGAEIGTSIEQLQETIFS